MKQAALQLHRSFEAMQLQSFALLSGGKSVHVVVRLMSEASRDEVREFSRSFRVALAEADPERFTIALPKPKRRGKIVVDFLRNHRIRDRGDALFGARIATEHRWLPR